MTGLISCISSGRQHESNSDALSPHWHSFIKAHISGRRLLYSFMASNPLDRVPYSGIMIHFGMDIMLNNISLFVLEVHWEVYNSIIYNESSYKYRVSLFSSAWHVMTLYLAGFEPAQWGHKICVPLPGALTIRPPDRDVMRNNRKSCISA